MILQVPGEIEAKLSRLAAKTGRTINQVALDLLAGTAALYEWFRYQAPKRTGGL